jgi:protein-disulfide isomerase
MAKVSKHVATLLIIAGCLLGFAGLKFYHAPSPTAVAAVKGKLPARATGNPDANIKIIEFIDFQCPACANGAKLLHEYLDKYPGKMYVELRYFPLKMHKHGLTSARWGECAARQDKFWAFLNPLLEGQSAWAALADPVPAFTAFAKTANVDMAQLNVCLADKSVDETINADIEEGKMRQVSSTPSYFINHELVVGTKSLKSRLDDLLGIKEEKPQETLKYDSIKSEVNPVDAN